MKTLQERWKEGEPILLAEYRTSNAETIKWTDKTSGRAREAGVLRHTVETGKASIIVEERTADDFRPETYVPAFKKGQRVAVLVLSLTVDKGRITIRGSLEPDNQVAGSK